MEFSHRKQRHEYKHIEMTVVVRNNDGCPSTEERLTPPRIETKHEENKRTDHREKEEKTQEVLWLIHYSRTMSVPRE